MSPITSHVLDTALGIPAEGIVVVLFQVDGGGTAVEVGRSITNADGRATDLLAEGTRLSGTYRLEFETANYFASTQRQSFYPSISVLFDSAEDGGHYHVPLLLSPYGYSTYRGS